MIVVTGGAGFIGSALISALNARGKKEILVVDQADHPEKKHNLKPLNYFELVSSGEFLQKLVQGTFDMKSIEAVFHLGACSDTTEKRWSYLEQNNVEYTKTLVEWCAKHDAKCIYASSAAVYGNGENGFSDNDSLFDKLEPLNLYGKSKLAVDRWARDKGYLSTSVGLRYFNVFGPNEYHKGHMRSVPAKKFDELKAMGKIELFKSYNPTFKDGESTRDFIYVKDAVAATLFFYDHGDLGGVFNVGSGKEESWNELAHAMFDAVGKKPHITYIDMPEEIRAHYQYRTKADISKLRDAGFVDAMQPLAASIREYVQSYLEPHKHLGE